MLAILCKLDANEEQCYGNQVLIRAGVEILKLFWGTHANEMLTGVDNYANEMLITTKSFLTVGLRNLCK